MKWKERSGDNRSRSPSLRRRILEPQVKENRHYHPHRFSSSAQDEPVRDGHAGSVRDHYNETCLNEDKDDHFRKLSQFSKRLQRMESPSKKFQWEILFAKNPATANSKSSLGLKHVNGCDNDNQRLGFSGSLLIPKSLSTDILEANSLPTFHTNIGATKDNYLNDGDAARSYGIKNDCSYLSPSRKFDGPIYESTDVLVRNQPMLESARGSYKEKRMESSSHETQTSHPQSKTRVAESEGISQAEFRGFYEGRLHLTSPDFTWKEEMLTEMEMKEYLEYRQTRGHHGEDFDDCNQYLKVQPSNRSDMGPAINSPLSQQIASIPHDDCYQDSTRTSNIMDPVVEESQGTESYLMGGMGESWPKDHYDFFKEQFIIEDSYVANAPFAMEQDRTGSPMRCEKDAYTGREKFRLIEDGFKTNHGTWLHEDGLSGLLMSEHDQGLGEMQDNIKQRREAAYSGLDYSMEMTAKRKCRIHSRCRLRYSRSKSSRKRNVFRKIHHFSYGDEQSTVEDIDIDLSCRNEQWNDKDTAMMLTSLKRPLPWQRLASQRPKSKRGDLMKRLGISLRDPSLNLLLRGRKKNKCPRNPNDNHGCRDVQGGYCIEETTKPSTTKSPEESEELNQLTKCAFFKFIKILSENPARRKKFTEEGSGTLKCAVCGSCVFPSNSEEFVGTLSLSQHAFESLEGSRAEHLGLHKALCWLMGWSSEAAPNSRWVQRILSYAEAFASKEDLIIWPPVLIIHNSSIANNNSSQRVTISCEELEVVIRGMGFGEKITVVRGKPANHSIIVVTFGAMFSGLQEAERLHKYYADNNRGRDEFQKLNSSHLIDTHRDLHTAGANKMESVLFGYLGLAEDLDKLDFETKKRSVVKSKKDIQAIVDASL